MGELFFFLHMKKKRRVENKKIYMGRKSFYLNGGVPSASREREGRGRPPRARRGGRRAGGAYTKAQIYARTQVCGVAVGAMGSG